MSPLVLETEGPTGLVVTRSFAASIDQVWSAHVEAEQLRRWLTGPNGWSMPVCQSDLRPGGAIRFEWTDGQGGSFHLTGEYKAIEAPRRIVHVERMHMPDPTPDNHVETRLEPVGAGTRLTLRMTLPDAATRDAMLECGMEHGMEASYARLEVMLTDA